MMTPEDRLSKGPVLRFTVSLFFDFKLFSFHIYCVLKFMQNFSSSLA